MNRIFVWLAKLKPWGASSLKTIFRYVQSVDLVVLQTVVPSSLGHRAAAQLIKIVILWDLLLVINKPCLAGIIHSTVLQSHFS